MKIAMIEVEPIQEPTAPLVLTETWVVLWPGRLNTGTMYSSTRSFSLGVCRSVSEARNEAIEFTRLHAGAVILHYAANGLAVAKGPDAITRAGEVLRGVGE